MRYLRFFEQEQQRNAVKDSLLKPNVSYVVDSDKVYYLNNEAEAEVLMVSLTGYQLYGEPMDDGSIMYYTFEYVGTREYEGTEYYEYSFMGMMGVLAPTRYIKQVDFPFDGYLLSQMTEEGEEQIMPASYSGVEHLYGFVTVPENKVLMKHRTDIGTNANGHAYVDLGLTSGTLWATCNVGAASPTQYGKYFQWGDTVGYLDTESHDFSWDTYKYGDGDDFTKYNTGINGYGGTIDNKLTLDLSDDAARANMGGDWRMPTLAQNDELCSETTNEWVTNYQGSGINGRLFTSKVNGNTLFIPASGGRWDTSVYRQGYGADLWSSSLYAAGPGSAWVLYFDSDGILPGNGDGRHYGFCVRGVL